MFFSCFEELCDISSDYLIVLLKMATAHSIKKLMFQVQFDNSLSFQTHRSELDPFFKKFLELKSAMTRALKKYLPVQVIAKKIPAHYHQVSKIKGNNLFRDMKINKIVRFPRLGSFQIIVDDFVVFSRLHTGEWPVIPLILEWAVIVAEKLIDIELTRQTREVHKLQLSLNINPKADIEELPRLEIKTNRKEELIQPKTDRLPTRSSHPQPRIAKHDESPVSDGQVNIKRDQGQQPVSNAQEQFLPQIPNRSDRYEEPASARTNLNKTANNSKDQYLNRTIDIPNTRQRSRKQKFTWKLDSPLHLGIKLPKNVSQREDERCTTAWRQSILLQPLPIDPESEEEYEEEEEEDLAQGAPTMSIEEDLNEQPIKKLHIRISQSLLNINRLCYEFNNDKIIKADMDAAWSPLLFEDPLPLQGEYYFAIAIRSQHNMAHFGIVPLSYYPKSQIRDNEELFLSYSASDGSIKDSLQIESESYTRWRKGGIPAPNNQDYQVRVVINIDVRVIDWYIDETIVGSAKLTKYYDQGFRPYISFYNVGDSAIINNQIQIVQKRENLQKEPQKMKKIDKIEKDALATRKKLIEMIDEEIQTSRINGTIKKQKIFFERQGNFNKLEAKDKSLQLTNILKPSYYGDRKTISQFQSPFEQFYGNCRRSVGIVYAKPSKMDIIPNIQSQREKNRQWAERELTKYREMKNMRLTSIKPFGERPQVRRSALK